MQEQINKQKSVVFVDFSGVNSGSLFKLRKQMKDAGGNMKVGKKTLARIALGRAGISYWNVISPNIPGQLAMLFGIDDEMAPAKAAQQFSKADEHFKILGGIFERHFVTAAEVKALAALPSRQQLLGQLVGSLAAPISGFENALIGNTRSFVSILSQIKK